MVVSVLNKYQVLTAAHCLEKSGKQDLTKMFVIKILDAKSNETHPKTWGVPWFPVKRLSL